MKDNLCFEETANTKRAIETMGTTVRKFTCFGIIGGYTHGYEKDTGDVLLFFPLDKVRKMKQSDKENFFDALKKNWQNANFKVVEEKELPGDEYFHVGFRSLFFRLKSLK